MLTHQDLQQNEGQFASLQPFQGLINGDQARPFFLKSGLPPNILAQIWQLSDLNKDGKLDRLEFSIAIRLIRNSLSGMQLPNFLPESMKQLANAAPPPAMLNQSIPALPARPTSAYGSLPATPTIGMTSQMYGSMNAGGYRPAPIAPSSVSSAPSFTMGIKVLGDWSIPQQLKLRFCQHFNQLDRNRVGLLTGAQARGVLGESQLPTNLLAQIWTMSDVNKDGCLSIEEFCVAMFLIEMLKAGYALPTSLPPELSSFCHRSKTASPLVDPNQPPPQKTQMKTFEDKRRDNLDRGQAELERRRQILREEEERRRAEIERKEREEAERRERERQELERRRDAEREAERLLEMEREKERAAEEEKLKAEREQARKLLEHERLKELEKIRIRDLENQQQHEVEKTTQIQQRHKTMTFQLQALDEKSQRLNTEITEARDGIIEITGEIEKMRESRDQKVARINELQTKSQQFAVQCERLSHENLQLQSECQKTFSRTQQIENLKTQIVEKNDLIVSTEQEIQNAKTRLSNQEKLVNEVKTSEFESGKDKLQKVVETYNQLVDKFLLLKQQAQEKKRKQSLAQQQEAAAASMVQRQDSSSQLYTLPPDVNTSSNGFESNFTPDFGSAFGATAQQQMANQLSWETGSVLVKYRALFEFVARSEDELSLQPGDVVLVFEGHASEPGWLAGQIKDKVGWFPASFAEPAAAKKTITSAVSITTPTSPSMEPLESIKEDPAEKESEFAADFGSAFSNNAAPVATTVNNTFINGTTASSSIASSATVASIYPVVASALYDAPQALMNYASALSTKSESNNSIKDSNASIICVGSAFISGRPEMTQNFRSIEAI
uniref:Intersectin-1 n=1 Tax=Ditylenchus dipsaci TaxID=166011 RepID=A0A915CXZ7_9BILA